MELLKPGIFLLCGLATGLFIPAASQKIIQYKCQKKNKAMPEFYLARFYKILLVILNGIVFAAAGCLMPLQSAWLVCVFTFTALVSILVDNHIRIICNEVVLFILVLGIAYRLIGGGLYALLGSLAALGIVIVVFGSAAALTKIFTKELGVGAGDLKLSMAVAVTVGLSGVFYFLAGVAVAIGGYCVLGLIYKFLTRKSTFPMCAHIMFGFVGALFIPYIQYISV